MQYSCPTYIYRADLEIVGLFSILGGKRAWPFLVEGFGLKFNPKLKVQVLFRGLVEN